MYCREPSLFQLRPLGSVRAVSALPQSGVCGLGDSGTELRVALASPFCNREERREIIVSNTTPKTSATPIPAANIAAAERVLLGMPIVGVPGGVAVKALTIWSSGTPAWR